ncbi:hypothetical protein KY284_013820 [Solanum tuberosum]|nr:hypothetical protein KY284_013820 [Solanum tuberosum]
MLFVLSLSYDNDIIEQNTKAFAAHGNLQQNQLSPPTSPLVHSTANGNATARTYNYSVMLFVLSLSYDNDIVEQNTKAFAAHGNLQQNQLSPPRPPLVHSTANGNATARTYNYSVMLFVLSLGYDNDIVEQNTKVFAAHGNLQQNQLSPPRPPLVHSTANGNATARTYNYSVMLFVLSLSYDNDIVEQNTKVFAAHGDLQQNQLSPPRPPLVHSTANGNANGSDK